MVRKLLTYLKTIAHANQNQVHTKTNVLNKSMTIVIYLSDLCMLIISTSYLDSPNIDN